MTSFDDASRLPPNFRRLKGTKVFRSARPEDANPEALSEMGISTILDLRGPDETKAEDTEHLNRKYTPYFLRPQGGDLYDRIVPLDATTTQSAPWGRNEESRGRHLFLPMLPMRTIIASQPWYYKVVIVVLRLLDKLFGSHLMFGFVLRFIISRGGDRCMYFTYVNMMERCGQSFRDGLTVLSDPASVPALVTCSLGKDRTGLMVALLLSVIGWSRDEIVADYVATEAAWGVNMDHPLLNKIRATYRPMNEAFLHAWSDTIRELLETLHARYGSVENYLESIGFGVSQQEALRQNILDTS